MVSCPHCGWTAALEGGNIFRCLAREGGCGKETCTLCAKPAHPGQLCSEVESCSATATRKAVEEAMTKARLRVCPPPCNTPFYKVEGCNKMTCSQVHVGGWRFDVCCLWLGWLLRSACLSLRVFV